MESAGERSRRGFLKSIAAGGTSFYLLPLGLEGAAFAADESETPAGAPLIAPPPPFFTDDERSALGALCDDILPGAARMGAVSYIETLLTAFEYDPPRIFACGPYSGRTPYSSGGVPTNQYPPDSFLGFQPLTRMQAAGWKLRLYGSGSVQGGYWNEGALGPVTGWRDLFKKGIADAMSISIDLDSASLAVTSKEFQDTLKPLVIEGCFCAPEYGGNLGGSGWKLVHYDGDSQPRGYSLFDEGTGTYHELKDLPMSTANPGKDPNKMGFLTRAFLFVISLVEHGRIFR
jgi:hypothetical protein